MLIRTTSKHRLRGTPQATATIGTLAAAGALLAFTGTLTAAGHSRPAITWRAAPPGGRRRAVGRQVPKEGHRLASCHAAAMRPESRTPAWKEQGS